MHLGYRMWIDLRTHRQFHAYYSGNYHDAFVTRLIRLMQPGGCVLDVGANVGFYTVALAQAARRIESTLHAFEALPGNCDRLISNLELNGVATALRVWRLGLSNQERTARLTLREDFGARACSASIERGTNADAALSQAHLSQAHSSQAHSSQAHFSQVDVELRTLDHFAEDQGLERLDLIKVDMGGEEDLLLEGGRVSFKKWRPILFMEVNKPCYLSRGVNLAARLAELLPPAYVTLASDGGLGRRWRRTPDLDTCQSLDNVFIVPEERLEQVVARLV